MKHIKKLINFIKERDHPNDKNKNRITADINPGIIFIYNNNQIQSKFIDQIKNISHQKELKKKTGKNEEENINKLTNCIEKEEKIIDNNSVNKILILQDKNLFQ